MLSAGVSRVFVSAVTVEEILRGALAAIRSAQSARGDVPRAYRAFVDIFEDLHTFNILSFEDRDEAAYGKLSATTKRLGSNDCRIAATAITRDYAVVTRNTSDFSLIPGARCEDWTQQ